MDRFTINIEGPRAEYIAELVRLGIHGFTVQEVVEHLLGHAIEQLIINGILNTRK